MFMLTTVRWFTEIKSPQVRGGFDSRDCAATLRPAPLSQEECWPAVEVKVYASLRTECTQWSAAAALTTSQALIQSLTRSDVFSSYNTSSRQGEALQLVYRKPGH